jgi:selenocysteine lyase/cysteine desulfurase
MEKAMDMKRRHFLGLAGLAAVGGGCAGAGAAPSPVTPAQSGSGAAPSATAPTSKFDLAASSNDKWARVRAEFNQDPAYMNFTGFLLTPHPRMVREAIATHRDALDKNPALVLEQQLELTVAGKDSFDTAPRTAAARFLAAAAEEFALTDSTTLGLGLVYSGFRVPAGKEVLTTAHDHYSTHEALRLRSARDGVKVRKIALYAEPSRATVDEIVGNLKREIATQTRVVGATWVHSSTGVKLPIRAMADVIAEVNRKRAAADRVWFVVDGVHGFGIENATMADLGCDVFIAGCHKWLFGPRGTGLVWARREAWDQILPTIPAFDGPPYLAWIKNTTPSAPFAVMHTPGGFHSFEHRWALPAAFAFQSEIGRAEIQARVHELNTRLKQGLRERPRVRLHTPIDPKLSSGITCFELQGITNEDVVKRLLEKKIIASVSPYAVQYARLAPGLLNNEQQVDDALAAVLALS